MRLIDRHPLLDAHSLVNRFVPPHRFEDVRFDTYIPDPAYASQTEARNAIEQFSQDLSSSRTKRRSWQFWQRNVKSEAANKPARYLDGGFGTGKTHLLASLWHASPHPKAYLTFTELTAFIGFAGMTTAVETFKNHKLLCIDEFELDDVANTLMVVSFLRGAMSEGLHLAVTSNTLPDRLGEQRFSANDFRREITAIAAWFEELRVDGPDYRSSHAALPLVKHESDSDDSISRDDFPTLMEHLRKVHPVQYGAMLDGLDGVMITDLQPIPDQDNALIFVQFVDKLYDERIPVRIEGTAIETVFDSSYRQGGYRKKYGRAESRMTAMAAETTQAL